MTDIFVLNAVLIKLFEIKEIFTVVSCIKTSGVEVNFAPPKKLGCSGYFEAMAIFVLTGLWPVLDAHARKHVAAFVLCICAPIIIINT